MKFARLFKEHLATDGYPPAWIDSAISYGQLKKCIKRVQRELAALGLDADTLHQVLQAVEEQDRRDEAEEEAAEQKRRSMDTTENQPFRYEFENKDDGGKEDKPTTTRQKHVVPKLQFVVDARTGEPISAGLSPETRNYLHQLAISEDLTSIRITPDPATDEAVAFDDEDESGVVDGGEPRQTRLVQIPLTTDSEFFQVLETELTGLAALQQAEREKIASEITGVSTILTKAVKPDSKASQKDLDRWRRLFECYIDSKVFFATNERDHGSRGSQAAARNFATFLTNAKKADLLKGWKTKESGLAFKAFLGVNEELLRALRFQEINHVAMTKILKKFDKRTALGASTTFSTALSPSLLSPDLSRALSYAVSTEILSIIPQLDDYLCPICMTIAYRPVRLKCGHLFCIRCLVLLQRQRKRHCALCREEVVMDANSGNLDTDMIEFLTKYFPKEVKEKQRDIEKQIAIEQFGEQPECVVM